MPRNYRYMSADSHFESPPEQWTHRVPKQYRERAPKRIKLADGCDALQIDTWRQRGHFPPITALTFNRVSFRQEA